MSTNAIGSLSSSYLQQVLVSALQNAGITANSTSPSPSDSSQLSPFAQLAGTLQQLQESDPTKYKQVTQQIAANLQTAAAGQLTRLASDFTTASQTGQLPNLQDLSRAVDEGNHHHAEAASSSNSSNSSNDPGIIILQTLASAGISTVL